ncbi:bifunctional aspartate kinase/homoserine dehydrogenase II [Paraferrimonas sp. SM1919]|uniref:bifunctional aspartate kinase/homoserine dehydrogenase II n=1 Tax=Paraferrimonas sp. SM1919 TaxID=2662263 RepID=UPI0013D2E4D9|nr:bifunctional aspartate kinase/homoserine dehydrogenase II [Paraferrimonas sp. SM1919]
MQKLCLHKFGGSSLADADCYRRVAHILLTHGQANDLIVVSAAGKSTNALYHLVDLANNKESTAEALKDLIDYQQQLIEQLVSSEQARYLREQLAADKALIYSLLNKADRTGVEQNTIISFGEQWSAKLLSALLASNGVASGYLDARDVLVAKGGVQPQIIEQQSSHNLKEFLKTHPNQRTVITGFICADEQGQTLLLGRNGSDYSATLITRLAGYDRVTIWTDVEGVFNADPNKISDAKLLPSMSLAEADTLARLGSPVLHPRALQPLKGQQISLAVRSSYAPDTEFTIVSPQSAQASMAVVTSLKSVATISLSVREDLEELLTQFRAADLAPLGYWRGYRGDVEFAFTLETYQAALELIDNWAESFGITQISMNKDKGLVALVSSAADKYRYSFSRLLSRKANPLYGDGLSLLTLVPSEEVSILTHKVHRRCAGPRKAIAIALFGAGNIGQAWIDLFTQTKQKLETELEAKVELVAIASSKLNLIDEAGIELSNWQEAFVNARSSRDTETLITELAQVNYDEIIALDISASDQVTQLYPRLFSYGIHLVSANKLAGSGPLAFYRHLKQELTRRRIYWRYNASVGAGLPVQYGLNDLINSGDKLKQIGGIFSGTLCWLFENYDGSRSFSELVLEAKSLGITEPDPRDDLSGKDMQRKLLILAREMGLELELDDINLTSLVPDDLANIPLEQFIERINELDAPMAKALAEANLNKKAIRYIAHLDVSQGINAKVALEQVEVNHPYANLTPGDNVFVLTSHFYKDNPLIIRGPGAGKEVTAAAVQSDLVQICENLLIE